MPLGAPSRRSMPCPLKTERSIPERRCVDRLVGQLERVVQLMPFGDDLRPAGAVCEQSVHEDDILRLQRYLGAGNPIEQRNGGASGGSPDQCPAVPSKSPIELLPILRCFRNGQTALTRSFGQ